MEDSTNIKNNKENSMKVKLKKEQLNFLDKYVLCIDTKTAINDKFQIACKGNRLIFSQKSNVGYLITELTYPETFEKEEKVIFETSTFASLIKSIPNNSDITITEKGINFNNNCYDIVNTDFLLDDVDEFLTIASDTSVEKFNLNDIENYFKIKEYAVGDKLDTVSYQNGYFVASNRYYVTGFVKTDNFKLDSDFYFSEDTFALFSAYKVKEATVYNLDDMYFFKLDDTFIFIPKNEYILPNMFDDAIKEMYEHPSKVVVNKNAIKDTLTRMKIVARNNKESRIYLELSDDTMVIKNTDTQFAQEDIKLLSIDDDVKGVVMPVSVNHLSSIIDKCDGENIEIYCTADEENFISMKIKDETSKYFYILNLLEK